MRRVIWRKVRAVLAQKLFLKKAGLPSSLPNQMKRLAAFQNPESYQKQSMRLSTATTPRVIACAEELPQHVGLPRGCASDLKALLREHAVELQIEAHRVLGEPLKLQFRGSLTAMQERAAKSLLKNDIGVFVAPPGVGQDKSRKSSCSAVSFAPCHLKTPCSPSLTNWLTSIRHTGDQRVRWNETPPLAKRRNVAGRSRRVCVQAGSRGGCIQGSARAQPSVRRTAWTRDYPQSRGSSRR